jgi:thioredoxin
LSQDDEIESINKKKLDEMMQKQGELRSSEASGEPIVLTDATFASEIQKHPLVVVDFWAAWCGPCRMVAPIVEQLAHEYAGKVTFGKLNVDENPAVSQSFGIQSIPTMIVFKNGLAVDGLVGALPKPQIEKKFKPYLTA